VAIRFESYRTRRLDNLGDPEWHNRRWQDIDLRMHARELDSGKIDGAVDQLQAIALARLNDTFSPIIQQAMNQLADVGVSFTGESLTSEIISLGTKTFIITPQYRVGLVVVDYVSIRPVGVADAAMICSVVSYDRQSGALVVEPIEGYITGEGGAYHDWTIRVSVTPNLDTYSRGEVDDQIDAMHDALVDSAPAGLDTIGKIAAVLGGAAGVSSVLMKANNLSDLVSAASARANLGLGNVNNTADSVKPVSSPQRAAMDQIVAQVFPAGTQMFFYQSVVPTGWIRMTTQNDKAIRVVSGTGGGVGGVQPFSTIFSRTAVDYTTLDGNTLPSHAHGVADPTHAHGVADPGHGHGIGDPGHAHGMSQTSGLFVMTTTAQYRVYQPGDGYMLDPTSYANLNATDGAGTGIWIGGAGVGVGIYGNYTGIGIYAAGGSVGHTHGFDHRVQYIDVLIGIKA
jgi:hypothetical protein